MELPKIISNEVDELCEQGSKLYDKSQFGEAINAWAKALDCLPEPRVEWDAYTWLCASIGDSQYQLGQIDTARHNLFDALNGPEGQQNPFIHFRLGQCLIKLGQEQPGIESLLKAYMLDGDSIFSEEEGGAIYLQLLREKNIID